MPYLVYSVLNRFELRRLFWVGSSRRDLRGFPDEVRRVMGYALFVAQAGGKHPNSKSLKGFGSAGVLEVVEDHHGDAFRTVYTVRFRGAVYVLHAFQKKSKRGGRTPKAELDLVASRLRLAERIHRQVPGSGGDSSHGKD